MRHPDGDDRAPETPARRPVGGAGPGMRPPSMADVARVAGVSHQTVSRVLNDFPSIRPETRQRVLEAISLLGYRRNTAARTLATNRSGSIGVITADMSHFGPASTMLGIEAASRAAGYNLTLVALAEITHDSLAAAVEQVLSQAVEALVVIVAHRAVLPLTQSLHIDIPVVVVEGDLSALPLTAGVDQVEGARLATRHLLDLGHETVAHLAGPEDWLEAQARREGWRSALQDMGRPGARAAGRGRLDLAQRLRDRPLGAMGRRHHRGVRGQRPDGARRAACAGGVRRRVPEDVSVVGFDDLPEAAYFTPPLTTVRQDFVELGSRAIGLILRVLAGEQEASVPLVEPTLVVRSSTAPPAHCPAYSPPDARHGPPSSPAH